MKIQILSDLHNEFLRKPATCKTHNWAGEIPLTDADLIILAGDIDVGLKGVEWAISESERLGKDILYIAGNHEFYGYEYSSLKHKLRKHCEGTRVYFLDCDSYTAKDVRFLGLTLWTDYRGDIKIPQDLAMHIINRALADHRAISTKTNGKTDLFKPVDALNLHINELAWLTEQLNLPFEGKTVIVTHHGPHPVCQHPAFPLSDISAAFHSDLGWVIEENDIAMWVYGHTHANLDTEISATRIISNQAGYPGEGLADFKPKLIS